MAFLWDGQSAPLLIPYDQLVVLLALSPAATDGQHKVHIHWSSEGTDLQVVRIGRSGVDAHYGFDALRSATSADALGGAVPELSHYQVQSILAWIGARTGHAVHVPRADRGLLDSPFMDDCRLADSPPQGSGFRSPSLDYIDVLWLHSTRNELAAAFEVEHSTPIYSGLLRFNDVHLDLKLPRAGIVASTERADVFYRQIARRTFRASGLDEVCRFYSYADVYAWYGRLRTGRDADPAPPTPAQAS